MIIDNSESLSIKPIKCEESNIPTYKKWKDKYKIFGFINNPIFGHDRPHCIHCNSTLMNESLRKSKLKNHFQNIHEKTISDPEDHLKSLTENNLNSSVLFGVTPPIADKYKIIQYELAIYCLNIQNHIAMEKKIIIPSLLKTLEILFDSKKAQLIKKIKLSNDTVQRKTVEMSNNISEQIKFSVQNALFGFLVSNWMKRQILRTIVKCLCS